MKDKLKIGDPLPHFSSVDNEGIRILDEDIVGYPIVMFFYPRNDSEITEKQVKAFNEKMDDFDELNALVIGINLDSVEINKQFVRKHKLNLTLFSDSEKKMCHAFGIIQNKKFYRSTFVIDSDGVVRWIEKPAKLENHVEKVLDIVKKHPIHRLEAKTIDEKYKEFIEKRQKKKKTND